MAKEILEVKTHAEMVQGLKLIKDGTTDSIVVEITNSILRPLITLSTKIAVLDIAEFNSRESTIVNWIKEMYEEGLLEKVGLDQFNTLALKQDLDSHEIPNHYIYY